MKGKKGITLIALVITIIVLLILAGVTVATLNGDNGILTKAGEAKNTNQDAEIIEQIKLAWNKVYTDNYLENVENKATALETELGRNGYTATVDGNDDDGYTVTYKGIDYLLAVTGTIEKLGKQAKWIDNGDGTFTHSESETKVQIGDIVNYNELSSGIKTYTTDTTKGIGGSLGNSGNKDSNGKYVLESKTYSTEDLGWRVLGVNESGQIELISENPMSEYIRFANEEGYLNIETKIVNEVEVKGTLDTMCDDLYGHGSGANSARSLNIDDIDKLAGIKTDADKKALDSNYGSKWNYRYPTAAEMAGTRYMQYKQDIDSETGDWIKINDSKYQTFRMPGESKTLSKTRPGYSPELIFTFYSYLLSQKINKTTADGKNMANLLSKGLASSNAYQYLATSCVYCISGQYTNGVVFCARSLENGDVRYAGLYKSWGVQEDGATSSGRVRPVVTLKSNVQFSGSSSAGWSIQE